MNKVVIIIVTNVSLVALFAGCMQHTANQSTASTEPIEEETNTFSDTTLFNRVVECGVSPYRYKSSYRYKYCGYAYCESDTGLWQPKVAFHRFFPETDSMIGELEFLEHEPSGSPKTMLSITNLTLSPGTYYPSKLRFPKGHRDFRLLYRDLNGGCTDYTTYRVDTSQTSTVTVINYDAEKREIKLRFDLYLKLKESTKPGYPEYIHLKNGVVFGRAIK
jgi:hypothetical protein